MKLLARALAVLLFPQFVVGGLLLAGILWITAKQRGEKFREEGLFGPFFLPEVLWCWLWNGGRLPLFP